MSAGFEPSTTPQRALCAALAMLLSPAWLAVAVVLTTHTPAAGAFERAAGTPGAARAAALE